MLFQFWHLVPKHLGIAFPIVMDDLKISDGNKCILIKTSCLFKLGPKTFVLFETYTSRH